MKPDQDLGLLHLTLGKMPLPCKYRVNHIRKEKSRLNSRLMEWPYIPMSEAMGFTAKCGKCKYKPNTLFVRD